MGAIDIFNHHDLEFRHGAYTVMVNRDAGEGFFEHDRLGMDQGGGLWFENQELVDYDGVYALPKDVAAGLRLHGFLVGPDFD